MSADGLPSTKEHPSALDGYERAKPGEPFFTLQGGDPLGIKHTRNYIDERRGLAIAAQRQAHERKDERAVKIAEAELARCTEAERTLWAMQEYLRTGQVAEMPQEAEEQAEQTLEAIDLHDYRVRAAGRLSNMEAELIEIGEELRKRGFDIPKYGAIENIAKSYLAPIREIIEPRRMMLEPAPKIG